MTVPCGLADSTMYRKIARHSARFNALRAASGTARSLRPQARFGAQPPHSGGSWRGDRHAPYIIRRANAPPSPEGEGFSPAQQKSAGTFVPALFPLVRKMGLEPTRHRHTHLKRACLPIPALPHSIDCKVDSTTPRVQKSSIFCKICTARGGYPKKVIQTSKNVLLHFLPALL